MMPPADVTSTSTPPRIKPPRTDATNRCHKAGSGEMRPKTITVCHPIWRLEAGGLERQLLQAVEHLPRDRFRHVVVVRSWDDQTALPTHRLGENVILVKETRPDKDPQWPYRLAAILREHEVDVLHIRGLTMLLDSLMAANLCGDVGVTFSFHGFEKPGGNFGAIRRGIYQAAISRCEECWAVSKTAAEGIAEELRMSPDNFRILPNGVHTKHYAPASSRDSIRHQLGLPVDRTIILSVGNLKPVKGHDVLLEAMRRLSANAPNAPGAMLVMVGRDYLDGSLQRWATENLSGFDVRFAGHQSDVLPWYQAADLFVLPSRWEGLSNALLEAMSCGLPVVATNVGGNRDIISHETTGLLVPPDNPDEMSRAIDSLLSDSARRLAFGEAGRREVIDNWDLSLTLERYSDCYTTLAERIFRRSLTPQRG